MNRGTARRWNANIDTDVDATDGNVGNGVDSCAGCSTSSSGGVIATDISVAGMCRGLVLLERVLLAEALVADFAAVQFDS